MLELAAGDPEASVRAKIIDHLAPFAGSALWPAIDRGLRKSDAQLKRAAILAAGATGYVAQAPRIAEYATHADVSVAEAVGRALGQLGSPESEPVLVSLLEHQADEVRLAAIEALGKIGTAAAVEPLLAETSGLLKDATLKRAAQQAISTIQARLGPVEIGQLSLATAAPLEGALSHVEQKTGEGALSLSHDDPAGPRGQWVGKS